MSAETPEEISVATVLATSTPAPTPPPSLSELAAWARVFWDSWMVMAVCSTVHVPFHRAGLYCVLDMLLVLLAHACANHRFVRETLREFRPFAPALMALWARDAMPSQSQLSRWLARIDDAAVEAWRTLFSSTSPTTA